ncbi:MAG TPA: FecR domain-containing protein [Anaeromyxobacter sp.]|nr:FecR domain-containing protein [Anaeromyxobacter sp.]
MNERARTREAALVAVLLAAGLGGGALLLRSMSADRAGVPQPIPPPPRKDVLVVAADAGVQRSAPGGGWTPAHAGDVLAVADSIRTGDAGTAEIELGRSSRVTVAERTEVTVRELTTAVQRVGLLRGRIGVDVQPDGTRVVRVEDGSGSILVSASRGRMGVVARPDALAVVAEQGDAVIESGGEKVAVPAGHESAAWRGQRPVAPTPVPRELLMRVVRAVEDRRSSVCAVVQVGVASEVLVGATPVEVPPDGRVVVRVPPRARRRGIDLVVRSAGGQVERQHVPCWEDEADVSDLEVRWNGR